MEIKKGESFHFSGGVIMDMAEAADLKRSKQIPQKYGGSAIESSIAAIADAAALIKHKKQY